MQNSDFQAISDFQKQNKNSTVSGAFRLLEKLTMLLDNCEMRILHKTSVLVSRLLCVGYMLCIFNYPTTMHVSDHKNMRLNPIDIDLSAIKILFNEVAFRSLHSKL